MDLISFVKSLPMDWVLAPIYKKGAKMLSGKEATGKNPVEEAHKRSLNRDDAALIIENNSSVGAVGLFTGPKGNGIVILDVDFQLSTYRKKWGNTLDGAPVVRSNKANAAKFIFRVPEELWRDVAGFGLCEQRGRGYEALWNRQGLIYGEYPGSKDGKAPAGHYHFEGDPESIPEAPGWLIAEMKAAKAPNTFVKNRSALDVSDRSEDDIAVIVQECTNVIPHEGVGSRDHWLKVGMAIHSVLPNDLGLTLWSAWSAKDPEYHDHWVDGNPCEGQWSSFKPGGIGLGTLIWMADAVDPKRRRFSETSKDIIEAAEVSRITLNRDVVLPYEEVIERGMKIYEQDDVARMNYELHSLSKEAGYRDQSQLEKLLLDHITQKNQEGRTTMDNFDRGKRDFLIPGLLPYGYLLLLFGDPGCGKSATALSLMKHVVDGIPFQLKNQKVPVKPGPVIYFNADMSSLDFSEEYDLHEIKNSQNFHFVPDFNLYRQAQFVRTMNEVKPSMICIDSLSSCSGAKAGDENKAEFAQPLYWLSAKNGILWPACTIVVLHHASKAAGGGARGSSAITAAVSEVWNISFPKKDSGLEIDQRVITVGKSRLNRSGESLIQTQHEDLTVSLVEAKKPEEMQTRAGTVAERIMNRLQTSDKWVTRVELNADKLVGGSVSAIRKTLQRLVNRGLVEVRPSGSGKRGKPELEYRALREEGRGESGQVGRNDENHCNDSLSKCDSPNNQEGCPIVDEPRAVQWDNSSEKDESLIKDSSADAGSEPNDTLSHSPRDPSDVDSSIDQSFWD